MFTGRKGTLPFVKHKCILHFAQWTRALPLWRDAAHSLRLLFDHHMSLACHRAGLSAAPGAVLYSYAEKKHPVLSRWSWKATPAEMAKCPRGLKVPLPPPRKYVTRLLKKNPSLWHSPACNSRGSEPLVTPCLRTTRIVTIRPTALPFHIRGFETRSGAETPKEEFSELYSPRR